MPYFPDIILIPPSIQAQIDALKYDTELFFQKHKEVFLKDINDDFIIIDWDILPKEIKPNVFKLGFEVKYSDELPKEIKSEYESIIMRHKAKLINQKNG